MPMLGSKLTHHPLRPPCRFRRAGSPIMISAARGPAAAGLERTRQDNGANSIAAPVRATIWSLSSVLAIRAATDWKHLVARRMTKQVVDFLEAVDVKAQDGKLA